MYLWYDLSAVGKTYSSTKRGDCLVTNFCLGDMTSPSVNKLNGISLSLLRMFKQPVFGFSPDYSKAGKSVIAKLGVNDFH